MLCNIIQEVEILLPPSAMKNSFLSASATLYFSKICFRSYTLQNGEILNKYLFPDTVFDKLYRKQFYTFTENSINTVLYVSV